MHITLESDYAVRIVDKLSKSTGRMDAKTISECTDVPLRFALKIMRKLVGDGIVKSYKGSKGGYMLARPAAEITLRQVIEAVEGPYRISRCLSEEHVCTRGSGCCCRFQRVFDRISISVRDELDKVTFADEAQN